MLTDRSRRALTFCSSLAIATALLSTAPANAQSFQGTGTFNSGSGNITTGTGTTTVTLSTQNAVIDWSPSDTAISSGTPINFQPAGTTATFTSVVDFSVLNRILPTDPSRPIQFNGTVVSQFGAAALQTGGTVYFYSPGGLIIGASAVFNVGDLGLTSIAPTVVGGAFVQTNPATGLDFVQFNGAVQSGSGVTIQPGAQITGTQPGSGSYLAVVAPVISQGGAINGKRVSALVSADAATITINPTGLFDIQVTSGTSGTGTTLFNNGSITGPAGDAGNASRLYMVAVPKNTAITMAIGSGSTLGFDVADAADVVGNAVVLSAGYDIVGGQAAATPSPGGGTGQANNQITGNLGITSAFSAKATGNTFVYANTGETMNFASNVDASGAQASSDPNFNAVQVRATDTGRINIAGNLTATALDPKIVAPASGFTVSRFAAVDADNGGTIAVNGAVTVNNNQSSGAAGANVTTGSARIAASSSGTIQIGGNATVNANSFISASGSATAGNAFVGASGGSQINVGGVLRVLAYGVGGTNNGAGGAGGNGIGGTAGVSADSGGDVFANQLNVAADGIGGADAGSGGGNGRGGLAQLFVDGAGSSLNIANGNSIGLNANGELDFLSAEGLGGHTSLGVSGGATGGTTNITVQNGAAFNGPANVGNTGFVRIIARATGGQVNTGGTTGGNATGGTINIFVDNATFTSADLLPSAFTNAGGVGLNGATGTINGGNAVGGNRNITIRNGATFTSSFNGGTAGGSGGRATASGRGGDASGGTANLTVDNATLNLTNGGIVFTDNEGGQGGIGGNASGGSATISIANGATVTMATNALAPRILASATNRGGRNFDFVGTTGGNATGGIAQMFVTNATVNVPDVIVQAGGQGGGVLTAQGGTGTGGTARLQMRGGSISGTTLTVDATGQGGVIDASFDANGNIITPAPAGNGGNGQGGFATLEATMGNTTLNFTGIEVRGDGLGGDALGTSGNGGAGAGGGAQLFAANGAGLTVNVSEGLVVNVDSFGGDAGSVLGNGGDGRAGSARVVANNGNITINGSVEVDGNAIGGNGVNGGNGFGPATPTNPNISNAFIAVNNGSLTISGSTDIDGDVFGGDARDGGNGGNASGGFAQIFAGDNNGTGLRGTISLQDVFIEADATGGSAAGTGNGGNGSAGRAQIFVNGGDIDIAGNAELSAQSVGGDGVNGGDAISPQPFRQPRGLIGSFNGTIDVAGAAIFDASAFGGNATQPGGARGGIAFAGAAGIDAQSQNGPSAVSVGSLSIDASGYGGFGGNGDTEQAGGQGGDGYGGAAFAQGSAGRGVLTVGGDTVISADGFGGFGGDGGSGGTTAAGGNGGNGGRGLAGGFNLGTVSGVDTPSNTGSATFGNLSATANGFGGDGGDGGTGTTQGVGGNGGTGAGGFAGILVRGSPATFGDVTFDASGFGGDGGAGSVAGNGGNGAAGDTNVLVTQRFMRTERGSLTANDLVFTANGLGGIGATNGQSFYSASNNYDIDGVLEGEFYVRQSDVSINSYSATYGGDTAPDRSGSILQVVDNGGIPVDTPITIVSDPVDINLTQATVNVAGAFSVTTPGNMRVVLDSSALNVADLTLSAGNFLAPATLPAVFGTITVANSLSISSLRDVRIYANLLGAISGVFDADGDVLTGDLTVEGPLDITALGSISLGNVLAGDVTLAAGTTIATAAISSGGTIDLTAAGNITTGALTASDSVFANAGGQLTTGAVSAGLVNPLANAPDGYTIGLRGQTGLTTGDLAAAGRIGVSSPGAIAVGNVNAPQLFLALPGTSFTSGSITTGATGRTYIASNSMERLGGTIGDTFDPAPILAAQQVGVAGPITVNGNIATGTLQANSLQALTITGSTSAAAAVLVGGTSLSIGNLTSGNLALLASGGALTTGNIAAGTGSSGKIAIGSTNGPVTTGALSTGGDLGIQTGGSITTGNLQGRDVLLLAGQSVQTGAVSALNGTQPIGRVYVGNVSQASQTANVFQQFNTTPVAALFNAEPTRIGGSLTFNGAINAGSLFASAAQGISLQAVTTPGVTAQTGSGGFIDLDSGGTVIVNGRLAAGRKIDIASADIVIGTNGSLDALGATGEIQLASNNASGMFVGDGASGTTPSGDRASGYVLDNAEFAKLKAGEIAIIGDDLANATDMTIGNLSIAGSQLYGSDGTVIFATGNRATETPSGILRIAGAVNATGFAPTQSIELYSGTVELEAANGSLKVADSSGGLGGTVLIEADRIHVASDAILTKLRADPFYAGRIAELNAPAATQRPDGVLNALGLEIFPGQTLYVQNTGSALVPAGFVTTFDNSEITAPDQPPTNGVAIVINGQFQTSTGRVTGAQAVNLILADPTPDTEQFFGFAADAQLNGCVFTGGCTASTETVNSVITSAIAAVASPSSSSGGAATVTNATVDDSPTAPAADNADEGDDGSSEEQKDEDSDADEGASPIAPPQPLISTRSLDGVVTVVEPVSGAGNPALIGSAVDETAVQGEPQ